ncbi:hypothetical protein Tco_0471843 [Tanacetum coccineum]
MRGDGVAIACDGVISYKRLVRNFQMASECNRLKRNPRRFGEVRTSENLRRCCATPHQRHRDTDVIDDFPNDTRVDLMAEKIFLLDLSQILRDVEGRGNSFSLSLTVEGREVTMDDYLCLPSWTGTVVTKGEKPNPKIVEAREKKEQQALLRIKAKRFDEDGLEGPQKKKKFRPVYKKRSEGDSGSERKDIEILKVDLSDPTKERTPSMNETVQEETSIGHENSPPNNEHPFDVLSHLVTPVEDAILAGLSNYKVLRRIYESLSRSTLAQAELLKRFKQLNHDYLDCQPSCGMSSVV